MAGRPAIAPRGPSTRLRQSTTIQRQGSISSNKERRNKKVATRAIATRAVLPASVASKSSSSAKSPLSTHSFLSPSPRTTKRPQPHGESSRTGANRKGKARQEFVEDTVIDTVEVTAAAHTRLDSLTQRFENLNKDFDLIRESVVDGATRDQVKELDRKVSRYMVAVEAHLQAQSSSASQEPRATGCLAVQQVVRQIHELVQGTVLGVLASTSTNVATCLSQQAHLQVFLNQDFDKVAETSAGHTATLQEIFDEVQGVKRSLGDIHKKLEETDGAIKTVSVLSSPTQAITAARVTADVRTLQDHFDNGLVEMDDKLEAIRKMLDKSSNVHNNAPTSLALSSQTESWQVGATVKASLEEWFKAATVDPDHPLNLILCSQVSTAIATSQSFKQEVDLAQLQRSYQTTADRLGDANAQLESLRKDKSQALEKLATFNTRVVQLVEKSETRMRTQLAHLVTFILELARAHGGLLEDYAFTLAGERQQRNALRDWLNAGEYSPQSNEERLESIHRIVEEILDGLWHTQTLGTVKQVEVDIVSKAEVRLRDVLGDDHNDVMKLCRSGLL